MIKNYFKTAWRSIVHDRSFSFINIIGLTIGISAALVIFLIVQYDLSFDTFEKDGDRIYRVVSDYDFSGKISHSPGVPHAMPVAVQNEVTGLDVVAPFRTWNNGVKVSIPSGRKDDVTVYKKETAIAFVDENYFRLINYQWIEGASATALQQPYQVVLTEANAALYFPELTNTQIIGKEIIFNDSIRTVITGVVKDIASNTDFNFKTFISRSTIELPRLKPGDGDEWGSTNSASQLFVKLSAGTKPAQVHDQIESIFKRNYKQSEQTAKIVTAHSLQPLSDLHFNADYYNFNKRLAHKPTLYALLAVAVFLLALGSINFINLSTAQASKRFKEIGIRKTMGSSRWQLVWQFLGETLLLTAIAGVLSLSLTPLLLKWFEDFIPQGLHFNILQQPFILLFLLLLVMVVSILSGFYPAVVLSAYKPVQVLKNQLYNRSGGSGSTSLRKVLIVSQFVIAQVFIIATVLVGKQISYSLNKDLGFKKDAVISFITNYNDDDGSHRLVLKNTLKAIPGIAAVSIATNTPSSEHFGTRIIKYHNGKEQIETEAQKIFTDTSYIGLYHLQLFAGTNLPVSDTMHSLVINETYSKVLGFTDPEQAIGQNLDWGNGVVCPIAGVVSDFHETSLHEAIKPIVLATDASQGFLFNVALNPQNAEGTVWKNTINKIAEAFKAVYPQDDFEYNFLDESIAKYYVAEQNTSRLLLWATGLAIAISCLGLLGLVVYITNQRTKEIGIRKVVGATVVQIIALISKDFMKLLLVACIVAIPLAWYGAHVWLDNFAYRTNLSWWLFLSGGVFMFFIAAIILCLKTFKAAVSNPVKSLRTE
ncbi:MAG: ABC transporter permease [Agriterribacter sp.]